MQRLQLTGPRLAEYEKLRLHVGEQIRERRMAMCLSQFDVSERAGMNLKCVGRLEIGQRMQNPTLQTLWVVARALECEVADLFRVNEATDFGHGIDGNQNQRLIQVVRKLPPADAKELTRLAESKINAYYKALGLLPPL